MVEQLKHSPLATTIRRVVVPLMLLGAAVLGPAVPGAQAAPCDPPIASEIACENSKPGNTASEWDVSGSGDSNIQGYTTDVSVDQGQTGREAFVGLDGRTYLFSGDRYLRYSGADYSTVDVGYPRTIAGDWGGGADIGEAALWHAMRSEDGRGERTLLASSVPAHFGLRRPRQVMEAMYFGRVSQSRVAELPPLVFAAAADDDTVARTIVERQADEIVSMAGTAIRRLRLTKLDVHVVLGGGIFRNAFAPFFTRIEDGVRRIAPTAGLRVLETPPVVGAALLGLDHLGATRAAGKLGINPRRPATLVGVAALAEPDLLVEVEAVAVLP